MATEFLATQWGAVDQTAEPGAFVRYLDMVCALETIQRIKQRSYDLLQVREGHCLLDVGCGAGDDVQALARRAGSTGRVVGVDCSETMLAEARKRLQAMNLPVELRVGDAQHLGFAAETFDGCRAERVFVHLRHPDLALAEMVRVARPGARIVVYDADWETLVVDAPDRAITRKLLNFHCDNSGSRWIGRQLRGLFLEAGLTEIGMFAQTLMFTNYTMANHVFSLQEIAAQGEAAGVVSSTQASQWLHDLERAHQRGASSPPRLVFVSMVLSPGKAGPGVRGRRCAMFSFAAPSVMVQCNSFRVEGRGGGITHGRPASRPTLGWRVQRLRRRGIRRREIRPSITFSFPGSAWERAAGEARLRIRTLLREPALQITAWTASES